MNFGMIRYILCQVMRIEGLLLILPFVVSVCYGEREGLFYLALALILFAAGSAGCFFKPKDTVIYFKESCVATSLSWILLSVAGCLPFVFTGEIPSFTDALFETISGFTTTGASILSDVESMTRTSLFWRSFTHWIGGMGVLVFLLAVIPMSGGSNINLMRAESPGPSVGKLVPKLKQTARILYIIYFVLTVIEIIFLLCGGLPLYDSICLSCGTAGTGGFGIKNDSFASYSTYIKWVAGIFMIIFGTNFNAFYFVTLKQIRKALAMEEVKFYLSFIFCSTLIVIFNVLPMYSTIGSAVTDSFFTVTSLTSSTGFGSCDFDTWPMNAKLILILCMTVGSCAGSTGGGFKVSRVLILLKTVRKELSSFIHPKIVRKVSMDGKSIEHEVIRSVNVYLMVFVSVLILSTLLVSIDGHDLETTFTAVLATLDNIGPGMGMVGPTCNYAFFSGFSKYVLMLDMLAGRLELFPILMLFHPHLYKGILRRKK